MALQSTAEPLTQINTRDLPWGVKTAGTAFPKQQWFRERASMLRYTYIACLILPVEEKVEELKEALKDHHTEIILYSFTGYGFYVTLVYIN